MMYPCAPYNSDSDGLIEPERTLKANIITFGHDCKSKYTVQNLMEHFTVENMG